MDECIVCGDKLEEGWEFYDDKGAEAIGPLCESCYMEHVKEVMQNV